MRNWHLFKVLLTLFTYTVLSQIFFDMARAQNSLGEQEIILVDVYTSDEKLQVYRGKEIINKGLGFTTKDTEYETVQGKKIQIESIKYASDSLEVLDYSFENFESGQKITLTSSKGKLSISHIEKTDSKQEILTADWKQGDLVGKTLAQAIMNSWKILMNSKKPIELSIFIPSKADRFRFEALPNEPIKNEIVTINVTASSWLVRQFVLPMTFNFKVVNQVPEIFSFGGPSPVDSGPYQGKPMLTKFKILKNPGDLPVIK